MNTFLFYTLVILASLFPYLLKKFSSSKPSILHPPTPPALPIIGHLHLLGPILHRSLQALANQHGPIICLKLASSTTVVVSSSSIAKEMLKDNETIFLSKPAFRSSEIYDIYGGLTFFNAPYGAYWRFLRKICVSQVFSPHQINRFSYVRREELRKLVGSLFVCYEKGIKCDLRKELMKYSNNVICRMAMSTSCVGNEDESKMVQELIAAFVEVSPKLAFGELFGSWISKLDLFGYGRRQRELLIRFDELAERIMVNHEKKLEAGDVEKKDMMDLLLEIHRKGNAADVELTRNGIKNFLLELFIVGTEGSSNVIEWTLAELINHPMMYNKIRQEIHDVVGFNRLVEESDVSNLPYLQAVIKESIRLHSPAPLFLRECSQDCKINGYDIMANERIMFNLSAIMRDPSSWENPLDFVPERFMKGCKESGEINLDDEMDIRGKNFKIFPFGFGRRGCPGASLSLAVVHVAVAALMQCFDLRVEGGGGVKMEEGTGFSGGLAQPVVCFPIMRIDPLALESEN